MTAPWAPTIPRPSGNRFCPQGRRSADPRWTPGHSFRSRAARTPGTVRGLALPSLARSEWTAKADCHDNRGQQHERRRFCHAGDLLGRGQLRGAVQRKRDWHVDWPRGRQRKPRKRTAHGQILKATEIRRPIDERRGGAHIRAERADHR